MIFDFLKKKGTHGRIEIPSLRIGVPLYNSNGNAQKIVDNKKSAVFLEWEDQIAIADHSGQDGFERLANAIPYQTLAYIDYKGKEYYLCTKKQVGHIVNDRIYDSKWEHAKSGGLVIYTCIGKSAEDVMDAWLTYWKRIYI